MEVVAALCSANRCFAHVTVLHGMLDPSVECLHLVFMCAHSQHLGKSAAGVSGHQNTLRPLLYAHGFSSPCAPQTVRPMLCCMPTASGVPVRPPHCDL